jgi:hypothetical protein
VPARIGACPGAGTAVEGTPPAGASPAAPS